MHSENKELAAGAEARLKSLSWRAKAAFALVPLALLLIVAETGFRIFGFHYVAPPEFGLVMAFERQVWSAEVDIDPDTLYRFSPVDHRAEPDPATGLYPLHSFRISDQGYRGEGFPPKKADPETARVLAYGDSVIFGVQSNEEQTIPACLERGLRERGVNAEVLNLALPSYTSAQNLWDFEARGLGLGPDVLMLHLGSWNDTSAPPNSKTDFELRKEFRSKIARRASLLHSLRVVQWVDYETDKLYRKRIKESRVHVPDRVASWLDLYADPALTRRVPLGDLRKIADRFLSLARKNGLSTLILVPALPSDSRERLEKIVPAYKDWLRSLPESENVKVVDLQPIVDAAGGDSLFYDFCHYTPEGEAAVARGLEEPLAELIRARSARH